MHLWQLKAAVFLQRCLICAVLLFIFLTVATMAQRVITKVHSLEQVIIGGLLGGGIGYILQKFGSSTFVRK